MNQFKSAWQFAFANWKFFLMLALPVIAIESLASYLVMPLGGLTQPEDFVDFFQANSLIIAMVGIVGKMRYTHAYSNTVCGRTSNSSKKLTAS